MGAGRREIIYQGAYLCLGTKQPEFKKYQIPKQRKQNKIKKLFAHYLIKNIKIYIIRNVFIYSHIISLILEDIKFPMVLILFSQYK